MTAYRDNYPFNIEAPQRVYVQYSQDIVFDYSTGKFPLGETFEGFIWENVYIPIPHSYGSTQLGRHVWMRWKVGNQDTWTYPMRITDAFTNIEITDVEEIVLTDSTQFRFKYTLQSGEIVYSNYVNIPNGVDGVGIVTSEITDVDLIITYSDGRVENVGRVVGYDGAGIPSGGSEGQYLSIVSGIPDWSDPINLFNNHLSAVLPIEYSNGIISHNNANGYRHIPTGGSDGQCLITNGSGTYTWEDRIEIIPIDDTAGSGDTNKLWSADKITSALAALQVAGIKYVVADYTALLAITGMVEDDLAVVESTRYVYKYDGAVWNSFFALDAAHNHDDRYYTEVELQTSGSSNVHWNNITNKPTFYANWTIGDGTTTSIIDTGEQVNIIAGSGVTSVLSGNTLTISATALTYTEGSGIDIVGSVISHEDTSSVLNTTNTPGGGQVIQNLEFDAFGHVTNAVSYNLSNLFGRTLTRGTGLLGNNYNGSTDQTWSILYGGSGGNFGVANSSARSDHSHTNTGVTVTTTTFTPPGSFYANSGVATKFTYADGTEVVNIFYYAYYSAGIVLNPSVLLGTIPAGYRPYRDHTAWIAYKKTDGSQRNHLVVIYGSTQFPASYGQIKTNGVGTGDGGTASELSFTLTYVVNP